MWSDTHEDTFYWFILLQWNCSVPIWHQKLLTSRYSSASSCYNILLRFQHNITAPSRTTRIFDQATSQAKGSTNARHQPAKWHTQSSWANSQASEAPQPASSCLLISGKAKSNEQLLEPHLWLSLGSCFYTKKRKNSFEDSMQPVGHVLCRPALLLVREGKTENIHFDKLEANTANVAYESICRFREEKTWSKTVLQENANQRGQKTINQ